MLGSEGFSSYVNGQNSNSQTAVHPTAVHKVPLYNLKDGIFCAITT
jgi:hypothetical protein